MRAGTQVAGIAIDRVFNPPIAPARKFRGTIDAALTLALGSVCAFGLTFGPAPMNTVALSAPTASSAGGMLEPDSTTILVPDDVENADSGDELPDESFRQRLPATSDSTQAAPVDVPAEVATPAEAPQGATSPSHPQGKQPPQHPSPAKPKDNAASPQFISPASAL